MIAAFGEHFINSCRFARSNSDGSKGISLPQEMWKRQSKGGMRNTLPFAKYASELAN